HPRRHLPRQRHEQPDRHAARRPSFQPIDERLPARLCQVHGSLAPLFVCGVTALSSSHEKRPCPWVVKWRAIGQKSRARVRRAAHPGRCSSTPPANNHPPCQKQAAERECPLKNGTISP